MKLLSPINETFLSLSVCVLAAMGLAKCVPYCDAYVVMTRAELAANQAYLRGAK